MADNGMGIAARWAGALVCIGVAGCAARAPRPAAVPPTPPAGASTADASGPGLRLSADVKPTAYRIVLRVDPARPAFTGQLEIDLHLATASDVIRLHAEGLAIDRATARAGGRSLPLSVVRQGRDVVALDAPASLAGAVTIALAYRGAQEATETAGLFRQKENGRWYSFTQFEPTFARRVIPSVDEPGRKTPWTLALEVPPGQVALANARQVGETLTRDGWRRVTFAPTRPLPTYLIAFAVGPFDLVSGGATRAGVPIRIAAPRGQGGRAAAAVELAPRALALLEEYVAAPYPYDKLDLVAIPITVGFTCMEHPGLITCEAARMLLDPAGATADERRTLIALLAHELAHQWFGNLVTPAWWDDLWLNEGLATWIERRVLVALDPRPDDALAAAELHDAAMSWDRSGGGRAIRSPIESADDIPAAMSVLIYDKGAALVEMLRRWIGDDALRGGLRAYLAKHADATATAADFLAAVSAAAGQDVSWLGGFLDQPGAPHLRTSLRCGGMGGDRRSMLVVTQPRYPWGSASRRWRVPFCFAYDRDGRRGETCAILEKPRSIIVLDTRGCPAWMLPNAGGAGHYRVTMTADMVGRAIRSGWSQMTAIERVVLAQDLDGMIGAGEIDVAVGMALVPRLLAEGSGAALDAARSLAAVRAAVPVAHQAAYDRWVVRTFGGEARRLGWLPRSSEPPGVDRRRWGLVPWVAFAGDAALAREAIRLAAAWRELPRGAQGPVLRAAIRADPTGAIFDRALADVLVEKDRAVRADLYNALGGTRDPERVARALQLLLDPRVDLREVVWLPYQFSREPERTQTEAFARDHLAALLARYPRRQVGDHGSPFIGLFTSACDASRRGAIAAYLRAAFAKVPGGPDYAARYLRDMDDCIASRARLGPALARWLAAEDAGDPPGAP